MWIARLRIKFDLRFRIMRVDHGLLKTDFVGRLSFLPIVAIAPERDNRLRRIQFTHPL